MPFSKTNENSVKCGTSSRSKTWMYASVCTGGGREFKKAKHTNVCACVCVIRTPDAIQLKRRSMSAAKTKKMTAAARHSKYPRFLPDTRVWCRKDIHTHIELDQQESAFGGWRLRRRRRYFLRSREMKKNSCSRRCVLMSPTTMPPAADREQNSFPSPQSTRGGKQNTKFARQIERRLQNIGIARAERLCHRPTSDRFYTTKQLTDRQTDRPTAHPPIHPFKWKHQQRQHLTSASG